MNLSQKRKGQTFCFASIKEVLAKANEEKSGDRLAGLAASSALERIAAKTVLAGLTLANLREEPVVPIESDEVSRLIDNAIDEQVYSRIKNWTCADLREFLLDDKNTASDIDAIRPALTGEMVAAVCKLMSNIDLVLAAKRSPVVVKRASTLGLPGRLGSRLQPNHPSDSLSGITASIMEGLSYGVGDAVIGINPVFDSAETVARLLDETDKIIQKFAIPTQNCVLSHITTQIKAVQNGAKAGLLFQSIAGTEAGNRSFGIDASLIESAVELGKKQNSDGHRFMYFETGQGSELSSATHNGADQVTLEARCYAFARLYQPFLVNDVVGFIGPEYLFDGKQMIRAGLEDHFMGKLLGLPMGIDACYTNHMDSDQNDLENLAILLTASGVNYFMGLPMGDDVMLSYQSTSFHDIASLREVFGLRPAPEFEAWLEERGLYQDGHLTSRAGQSLI